MSGRREQLGQEALGSPLGRWCRAVTVRHIAASDVPSRRALEEAEAHNRASADGLRGYLSEQRGFLPPRPPDEALPASHRPWDELAARLPELFRSVSYRDAVQDLAHLDATRTSLPDHAVRRAATVLGILAHTWFRVDTEPPGPLPDAIARPWREVCERLDRPSPFLDFEDITTANWKLLDPHATEPMRVENLDLLVPSVGNDAERFFMMTLVELAARATPIVGAVVRAQECMASDDRTGIEAELVILVDAVRRLVDGLVKADPNPYSPTYVDPVVWGVTVAPFAVSVNPEMPSPGGTAAPLFQVLDAFLGRRKYGSVLGEEIRRLHRVSPSLHRSFMDAIAEMPIGPYLERSGTSSLRGLTGALMDAYAGEQGLLQLHRIKAYGYLEVAFKVGRPVTLSGFAGVFRDRPWKRVDEALDASMQERVAERGAWVAQARVAERTPTAPQATASVTQVTFDVHDQGAVFAPGDRLALLPENSPELVDKTIAALRAAPDTEVKLTSGWRVALGLRGLDPATDACELHDFLRWAKLRPLLRPVAKTLHSLSKAPALGELVEQRFEDQLELWDAFTLMTEAGYDVRRLTDADPWQPESLAALVPPEVERLYSISSAPTASGCQDRLALTVGDVSFRAAPESGRGNDVRHGVASHWLNRHMAPDVDTVPFRILRPKSFQLPDDPSVPVVMFAGGTGLSPFRGFLLARTQVPSGPNVLFYGARRAADVLYRHELDGLVGDGALELHVALSQDERRRIDGLIDEHADRLWNLLENGAVVYVCGQGGFAHTVVAALQQIADGRCADGGHAFVRRLVGERRLRMDVFTTTAPVRAPGPLGDHVVPASELVTRNDDDAGYWMAIDGAVYDVSEFQHLHPGGPKILVESAGTDATAEYRAVLHHLNGEVGAMLAMYKVGLLRRLRLGSLWGIAAMPDGFADVSLADLYRAWVRYTYLVVEMQNALRNDWTYRDVPLTRGEDPGLTTQKLMYMANTHDRFVVQYLDGPLGDDLTRLWRMALGLCRHTVPMDELPRHLDRVRSAPEAAVADAVAADLRGMYVASRDPSVASDDRFWSGAARVWDAVRDVQERYLSGLKAVLRQGLVLFEAHEGEVIAHAGPDLVDILRSIPTLVAAEHREMASVPRL